MNTNTGTYAYVLEYLYYSKFNSYVPIQYLGLFSLHLHIAKGITVGGSSSVSQGGRGSINKWLTRVKSGRVEAMHTEERETNRARRQKEKLWQMPDGSLTSVERGLRLHSGGRTRAPDPAAIRPTRTFQADKGIEQAVQTAVAPTCATSASRCRSQSCFERVLAPICWQVYPLVNYHRVGIL